MSRKFGPKPKDALMMICPICEQQFKEGDYTTLVTKGPADEEEAEKKAQGRAYNAEAKEIHWEHAMEMAETVAKYLRENA